MLVLYIILALFLHYTILMLIDRQVRTLGNPLRKWRIPRRLQILLSFVIVGAIFGSIAMAINDGYICLAINPLGSSLANMIHDNWWTAEYRPLDWESKLPWIMRHPQDYLYITIMLYAIISSIFMIKLWRDNYTAQDFMFTNHPGF